jgi:hypothetical protein
MAVPPDARAAWESVFGAPAPAAPRRVSFMHSPLLFPTDAPFFSERVAAALPEHLVPAEADAGAVEVLACYGEDLWAADTAASAPAAAAATLGGGAEWAEFANAQRALDGAVPGAAHAPAGFMPEAVAVCRSTFGRGRVLLFSPHPEAPLDDASTVNRELVRLAAAWAAAALAAAAPPPGDAGGGCAAAASGGGAPPPLPPPCAHAAAALAAAAAASPCATPAGGAACGAAAAAKAAEAAERPTFICLRHLRAGAYHRCQAAGCPSNTRGLYACLACGAALCGRGAGTHMGTHSEGHGGPQAAACVAVYFGIPPGFGNDARKGAHAWCYACEKACALG